jgi:GntR family transcriptional regulator of vanillate catabolism
MDSGARGEQNGRGQTGAETIAETAMLVRSRPAATLQSQRIYDRLRHDIAGQRLQPGTVLNEIALAEDMEASRTPLREALTRLRQQGFLERKGRQLAVKSFTLADVRDLYQLREALERIAIVLCVERASDADLLEIGEQLERYGDFDIERDYAAFNEYANQFHRSLADICGNPMIRDQLYAIHDKVLVVNARFWRKPRSADEAYEGHRFLLHAIQKRDGILAEAAMRAHIREVVDLYLEAGSCPRTSTGA